MAERHERSVRIETQLRVTLANRTDALPSLLKVLREHGGDLRAHLIYEIQGQAIALFVCEKPREAKLALQGAGLKPETETVVLVRTENRRGALSHLLRTLETAAIKVGYSYAASVMDDLCVVLRTNDDQRAEEALRRYLILVDRPEDAAHLPGDHVRGGDPPDPPR